jgi:hypothetical protein
MILNPGRIKQKLLITGGAVGMAAADRDPCVHTVIPDVNLVLAEIHDLLGQSEKTVFYAREGLMALKGGRFDSALDPFITKLAVRFWNLLGRIPV